MSEFLNVYNFVPFPEEKQPAYETKSDEEKLTGVIHYTITPITPIFIPNTSSDRAFSQTAKYEEQKKAKDDKDSKVHNSFDFYSYTNLEADTTYDSECHEPVIPGSEIRGVIRSLYETLTDSCMSTLNEDVPIARRIAEAFKPGLLKRVVKDGKVVFELYKARSIVCESGKDYFSFKAYGKSEGAHLYYKNKDVITVSTQIKDKTIKSRKIRISNCSDSPIADGREGYLIIGAGDGSINRKRHAHLLEINRPNNPNETITPLKQLSSKDIDRLEQVVTIYKNQPLYKGEYGTMGIDLNPDTTKYDYQLNRWRKGNGEELFPVYYSEVGSHLYLSPACVTRELYNTNLREIAGVFAPCKGKDKCPACDLFGRIDTERKSEKNNSITSRIRFSDARVVSPRDVPSDYYVQGGKPLTLATLGGPKLGNIEFYLERPEGAQFWTYDYYIDSNGNVCAYDKTKKAKLKGRKYYWHHNGYQNYLVKELSNLNKTVRLLDSGKENVFKADLYFDGITKNQLHQLLWILDSGSESEKEWDLAYKIGGGKPFGLGSIKCEVTGCDIRRIKYDAMTSVLSYEEEKKEKSQIEYGAYVQNGFSQDADVQESIKQLCGLKLMGQAIDVTYPRRSYQKPL